MARARRSRPKKATRSRPTTKPFCSIPARPVPDLAPHVMANTNRAAAIIRTRLKWVNGTVIHYCFFGGSSRYAVPKTQAAAIRGAFRKWKAVGIGLEFQEVDQLSEAEVRIGYSTADGTSASSVGRAPGKDKRFLCLDEGTGWLMVRVGDFLPP